MAVKIIKRKLNQSLDLELTIGINIGFAREKSRERK